MKRIFMLLLWLVAVASEVSYAQDFPNKPIRMVVPYAAGGLPDVVTRLVGQRMTESTGQQVIIENRPGAGGIGATEAVAKSAPDGYTLLVIDGQLSINPYLYSKLPYDPDKDFVNISLMVTSPLFLAINANVPVGTLPELIALAKAKPGTLNYGSSGTGSSVHLAVEAFKAASGINIVHSPFKGSAAVVQSILSGDVSMGFVALSSVSSLVKSGKVKLLAVSTLTRSSQAPDVPTFGEFGIADYDYKPQIGVVAPAGTPAAIVVKLSAEIAKAVMHPETVQRLAAMSINPVGSTPEAFAASTRADAVRYARVVKLSGAKAD